jgi:rhamnosyl/mannosyltransferase
MAAGLPIINTALPSGVPTVARHGIEALTVPPGDSAQLAGAIRCLLDSPGLAATLGSAGKKRAAAEYDLRMFIDRTHALYADSIATRSRRVETLQV